VFVVVARLVVVVARLGGVRLLLGEQRRALGTDGRWTTCKTGEHSLQLQKI